MSAKKGGLNINRGLSALLVDNSIEELNSARIVDLKLMEIEPNKEQARKDFESTALATLAESIAQNGVLQPLIVRPIIGGGYRLIAGERRWHAARMAGLTEVPVIIKEVDDTQAAVLSLIENLQREDLNPIEEALGLNSLTQDFGLTQEQVAERVGKSRPTVANLLRLLTLPQQVIDLVRGGELSAGHAKALAGLQDEDTAVKAAKFIIAKGLSVREAEKLVKSMTAEKKERKVKAVTREAFFDEVELSLGSALGRRAKVTTNKDKQSGTLQIDFYDKDDLARLAKALGRLV